MDIEVTGHIVIGVVSLLAAAFVVRATREMVGEELHRFLPLPLAALLVLCGIALATVKGLDPVDGGTEGFIALALAWYGPELYRGVVNTSARAMSARDS